MHDMTLTAQSALEHTYECDVCDRVVVFRPDQMTVIRRGDFGVLHRGGGIRLTTGDPT